MQKSGAAGALFDLVAALKTVIRSGPVDQITRSSRYSLSEEHLMRLNNSLEVPYRVIVFLQLIYYFYFPNTSHRLYAQQVRALLAFQQMYLLI